MVNQASFLPSIFADPKIAERVDRQLHFKQQVYLCKKTEPLIFAYCYQTLRQQDPQVWHKLIDHFAQTNTKLDRNQVLQTMAKWMLQNMEHVRLKKKLDNFMLKQEKKIVWIMQYGIHVPEYQQKVALQIEKFRKFRVINFDPFLISR